MPTKESTTPSPPKHLPATRTKSIKIETPPPITKMTLALAASPTSRAKLVDFFAKALIAFQNSQDSFRVVCSLPSRQTVDVANPIPSQGATGKDTITSAATSAAGATTVATTTTTDKVVTDASTGATAALPPSLAKPSRPVGRLVVLDSSFNPPTLAHMGMAVSAASAYSDGTPAANGSADTRILLLLSVKNADKAAKPASFPQRLAMMYVLAGELLAVVGGSGSSGAGEGNEGGEERGGRGGGVTGVDVGLCTLPYFHDKCAAIGQDNFYYGAASAGNNGGKGPEQIYLAGYDTLIRIFNPKYYGEEEKGKENQDGSGSVMTTATTTSTTAKKIASSMQVALGPFFDEARLRITLREGGGYGAIAEQRAYLESLSGGGLEAVGGLGEWAARLEAVEGGGHAGAVGRSVSSTLVREDVRTGNEEGLDELLSRGVKEWVLREGLYRD